MRVDGRELQGLGAEGAVGVRRKLGATFCDLAGAAVVARDLAAVDDVGVEGVGGGVAVLFDADGMPVAEGDRPSLLRLGTQAEPLSCWPPQTR